MSSEHLTESSAELPEWPEQVIGGKSVRLLETYLRQLRGENEHGNRQLFLDDVFVVYLLAFFTPSVRSLRMIEDFSQTRQAQKHLSIGKICKSTLSDFNRLVEPQRLEPIIRTLRSQLSRKQLGQAFPEEGVLCHLYVTIIAVLLMFLHTGYRPSKYMFALVGQVAAGAATLDEIMPILRERERQNELARQSAARRRAQKTV
ncbi:MAG: hypothetical protein Tsb009_38110 [Planctomycetaceae bacterium]